jgi:peptidyl-prolyl cis-trans isomerase B (cyclophilin B)
VRHLALIFTVALVPLAATGCGSSKSNTSTSASTTPASTNASAQTSQTSGNGCTKVQAPAPRKSGGEKKPKGKLDPSKTYTVTMNTNCGTFAFTLDVKDSPETTSAFAGLVKKGFFDGLTFHRIVPGFVIQGGDPAGTGTGGPGFHTVDPPPKSADYTLGTVAMAKTQTEPAGAAGSQFFVVTGQDAQLPPDYALLGKVTSGEDVVDKIGLVPSDPQTQAPNSPVVIKSITVTEK